MLAMGVACCVLPGIAAVAQETPPADAESAELQPAEDSTNPLSQAKELVLRQSRISDAYARLEGLMLRRAEIDALTNPRRATLLRKAIAQSKEKHVSLQLETLVTLLANEKYNPATRNQAEVRDDLKALLELLLSESRSDRIKSKQRRIREYINDAKKILNQHRGIQGRTEGGDDAQRLAKEQGSTADRAGELAKRIQENEEGGADSSSGDTRNDGQSDTEGERKSDGESDSEGDTDSEGDSKSKGDSEGEGDSKSKGDTRSKGDSEREGDSRSKGDSESEGDSQSEGDSKSKGDSETEGDSKSQGDSESKGDSESEGDSRTKGDSQSEGSSQSEGDSKRKGDTDIEGDSSSQGGGESKGDSESEGDVKGKGGKMENPARKRIQAAEERMRQAQQRLEEAKRKEAVEEQEEAKKELERAIAELEEILRQLREEEIERTLAMLEARFVKMLQRQLRVYESTKRLDKLPDDPTNNKRFQANELSFEEKKIAVEAGKALNLLREEGSSVAFPETVEMMREDMVQVAERLADEKVGRTTQLIEEDIIAALEEMIEALQQAQQDMEDQKNRPQPPQPTQPQDQPLVDMIAELKLIRSLQLRVNTRTQRYSRLLEDEDDPKGQATSDELVNALKKLADRERRIKDITREIVLGKNQ
jgi:hypothetical protein